MAARTVLSLIYTLGLALALAACGSLLDSSPPDVLVSVRNNDLIRQGDVIRVTVVDAQSGVASVSIDFAGGNLLFATVPTEERDRDALTFEVEIAQDLSPGAAYDLDVVAVNGVGVTRRVEVVLIGGAPGEVAAPPGGSPSLAFIQPSPTPGERLAGFVTYTVQFDAPRGFGTAEVSLTAEDGGSMRLPFDVDAAAGILEGRFLTLDLEAGNYVLSVTIIDEAGASANAQLPVQVLPPYMITNPSDDANIGAGATPPRQIVAVTVGVNGTVRNELTVTAAHVYVNGLFLANAVIDTTADDNRLIVYAWDTATGVVGVHDASASGDRVITVKVFYTYVDDEGQTVNRSRFTPGVLVRYSP